MIEKELGPVIKGVNPIPNKQKQKLLNKKIARSWASSSNYE